MRGWCEAERLRLLILFGMQARLDLPEADDDDGQDEAEEQGAHRDHTREADGLEHDVAKTGHLVRLDNLHYDGRAWRLHRTSVSGLKGRLVWSVA